MISVKEFAVSLASVQKTPLYEQIYEAFREAILEGRIPRGEKLPSTRQEALFLSCSRSTVEMAYDQLLSEGYIESRPCSGFYACDVRELYHLTDTKQPVEAPIEMQKEEIRKYRVNFSPNGIALSAFPFPAMGKIFRNLLLDEGEAVLLSNASLGDADLRQTICDYLFRFRNVSCIPEQIVVGAGNEYLLILLSQVLGDSHAAAMESPTYLRAYQTFRNIGYPVEEIGMDADGMRVDALSVTGADIAYVMPSHQFPTGTVMPMKRRLELISWAVGKEGRYIIEDDYDSEFRYKGKPIPALQGMDRMGRVIYIGTFSRSIAPSVRVSYMVLPRHLMGRFRERCGFYACTVPSVMQQAICHFMKEGYFEKNLNRMRGIYKAKHDFILNALRNCAWAGAIHGENSGLHLVVELKGTHSETEIIEKCKERGVRVYGMSEYFISRKPSSPKASLLLGYGGLTEEEILTGLQVIGEVLAE